MVGRAEPERPRIADIELDQGAALGLQFAGAYLAVNLWALAIQGNAEWVNYHTWGDYPENSVMAPNSCASPQNAPPVR